jgi:Tol biopolymer transport system component
MKILEPAWLIILVGVLLSACAPPAPNDTATHLAYARFLSERAWSRSPEPYYSQARRELDRAVQLGSENQDARSVAGELDMIRDYRLPTLTTSMAQNNELAFIQNGNLWVKELPAGEAKQLTTDGQNRSPRWSPSGEWLAFYKGHQAWVTPKSGLPTRAFPGCSLDWSPTSDTLLCTPTEGRTSAVAVDGTNQGELPPARRGRAFRSITAWSPDGRWLAYDQIGTLKEGTPPDRYASLWRMRPDGSDALELLNAGKPSPDGFIRAGWSSDGSRILFWPDPVFSASILADGVPLEAISINGGKPYTLTAEMLLHSDWMDSSGGGLLAVTEGGDRETWTNKHIAVVDPASGNKMRLTDDKTAAFSPAWSADGQHIAYVAAPDIGAVGGGNEAKAGAAKRRIWAMDHDGANQRQLTSDPAYRDERPLWSADGRNLIFARLDNATDNASIWLMPSEGGEPRRVVDVLGALPPESTWFGYYGHIDWSDYFDLWTPPAPARLPDTGANSSNSFAPIVLGILAVLTGLSLITLKKCRMSK